MIVLWVGQAGRHLSANIRAKAMEWVLTLAATGFGYGLLQPADTFSMSPSFRAMQDAAGWVGASENQIGWSIFLFALVRFAVLAYNGAWQNSPKARRYMALMFCGLWAIIFVGFWSSVGFTTTGTGVYLALTLGEVLNMTRAAWEEGQVLILRRGHTVRQASHNAVDTGN